MSDVARRRGQGARGAGLGGGAGGCFAGAGGLRLVEEGGTWRYIGMTGKWTDPMLMVRSKERARGQKSWRRRDPTWRKSDKIGGKNLLAKKNCIVVCSYHRGAMSDHGVKPGGKCEGEYAGLVGMVGTCPKCLKHFTVQNVCVEKL